MLSGQGGPERALTAMRSATSMLVDDELKIVKLFTPPFDKTEKDPGYIKSYPPGVRENGGQYTHAATWFVIALAELGLADEAWRAFCMLNPVNHALDAAAAERYRVEPYVVAADIYSTGAHRRARRLDLVHRLGRMALSRGDRSHPRHPQAGQHASIVNPVIPTQWDGFSATLRLAGRSYRIDGQARSWPDGSGRGSRRQDDGRSGIRACRRGERCRSYGEDRCPGRRQLKSTKICGRLPQI